MALHFLVVPVIGAWLATSNYVRLGDRAGALRSLLMFTLPAIGLVGFTLAARNVGQIALLWVVRLALTALVFRDQRPLVKKHFEAGGLKARWYVGWAFMVPLVLVGLALWQVLDPTSHRVP